MRKGNVLGVHSDGLEPGFNQTRPHTCWRLGFADPALQAVPIRMRISKGGFQQIDI